MRTIEFQISGFNMLERSAGYILLVRIEPHLLENNQILLLVRKEQNGLLPCPAAFVTCVAIDFVRSLNKFIIAVLAERLHASGNPVTPALIGFFVMNCKR